MKNIVRNLTALSCVASSAFAAPFLAIGDNAELFAIADLKAAYNDNILLAAPGPFEDEDTVVTFVPGFDLVYGKDSLLKGNLVGTATLTSYSDNSELNNQLLAIAANSSYESASLSLNAFASFKELDQATVDVLPGAFGRLIERHIASVGINGEYAFSEKISLGSGVSYNHVDYKEVGYTEQEDYTVPVNIYYELTPKVDLSAGIRYVNTELDTGIEYDAFYYNVGARGSFTPKLSGSFSVGYNTRDASGPGAVDDDGSIGADASLAYAYSDKTQFTLSLARNYTNSASGGASYENTQVTLGASNAITVDWRLNASITYRTLDYQNVTPSRTDDYIEGSVGATYIINSHLSASLSYLYRENSSDVAGSEFTNNVVSLSLSARY